MNPPKSILDKMFVYTPSHQTDIRKTFAKIKREIAQQAKPASVVPIKRSK